MKKTFILSVLFIALAFIFSCEDDDDDNPTSTNTTTNNGQGSGSGAGTGGGTGSGGIPPNSMKATINGNVIDFANVFGSIQGSNISISGTSANVYPQLIVAMADTIVPDTFLLPGMAGEPSITYSSDANNFYVQSSGQVIVRTLDTARKLVNGRFEGILKNTSNPNDSVIITEGEFNRFYD